MLLYFTLLYYTLLYSENDSDLPFILAWNNNTLIDKSINASSRRLDSTSLPSQQVASFIPEGRPDRRSKKKVFHQEYGVTEYYMAIY